MNVAKGVLVILLIICAIEDIKERAVAMSILWGFGVTGALIQWYLKNETIWSLIGGIGIGFLIMGISYLTKGGIGMGDGMLLVVTGIYLGVKDNFLLLMIALLGVLIWALILMFIKKGTCKSEIPFIPFVLVAYIGILTL